MAKPLAEAPMIIEKEWDIEKPQEVTGTARRKSKSKASKASQEKRKEKTQYERYMDVESFWKQISPEQRRQLLKVPLASILEAVKKSGVPETTEALIEGLVLLREHNNRNARYWWCAVCDQKFQSCKDYLTHVELFHEELAQVDNHYLPCSKCQNNVVGMYWSSTKAPGYNLCFKCYTSQLHNPASAESVSGMQKVYPRSSAGIPAWSETSDFISTRDSFASFTDDESQQGASGLDPLPGSLPSTSSLPPASSVNPPLSTTPLAAQAAASAAKAPFFSTPPAFFPQDPSTLLMPLQPPPAATAQQPSLASASQPPPLPNPSLPSAAPSTSTADKFNASWTPDLSKYKHILNLAEAADTPQTSSASSATHVTNADSQQTGTAAASSAAVGSHSLSLGDSSQSHTGQPSGTTQDAKQAGARSLQTPAVQAADGSADQAVPSSSHDSSSGGSSLPVLALDTSAPVMLLGGTSQGVALHVDAPSISQLSSLSALSQNLPMGLPVSSDAPLLSTSEPLLSDIPPFWDQNLSALVSNVIETLSNGKAWTADSLLTHQALHAVAHAAAAAAAAASNSVQHAASLSSVSEIDDKGSGSQAGGVEDGMKSGDGGVQQQALAPALSALGDGTTGGSLSSILLDPSISGMLTTRQLELVGSIQLVVSEVMKRMRDVYSVDRQLGQLTLESVKQFVHRKLSASMEELCKAGNTDLPESLQLPPEMKQFLVSPDAVLTQPDMLQVVLQCLHLQDLQMVLAYVVRQHTDVFAPQTQQRSLEDVNSEDLGQADDEDEDEDVEDDEDDVEDDEDDEEEQLDMDAPLDNGDMTLMPEEEDEEEDDDEDEDEDEEDIDNTTHRPPLLFQLCNADDRSFDKVMEEVWGTVPWGYTSASTADTLDKDKSVSHARRNHVNGVIAAGNLTGDSLKAASGHGVANHVGDKGTSHSCNHVGCCDHGAESPVLEVVPWWVQHLADVAAAGAETGSELGVLRWVYGKLVNSQMEQFAKRQSELRGGRPREVVMLEVYEEIAFLWRQLQDFTDRRNRLEELRKSARYHFTRVKSLQKKGDHCTPEQACEFLAAILAAYYSQQQGVQQPTPVPPPSFPAQSNTPSTSATVLPALPTTAPAATPNGSTPVSSPAAEPSSAASTSDPGVPAPATPEPPSVPPATPPSSVPRPASSTDPQTASAGIAPSPTNPTLTVSVPNPGLPVPQTQGTLTHPPPPPYPPTPVPQPALYMCEAAVDVVRRHPQLAQEPSQLYTRALLDRELAVLSLAEAMLLHEAETAEREVSKAEEVVKKCSAEAGELELEYQRVSAEGPANHRKRDMLDKATKEAEHRERLQDLVNRIAALKDQMVAEQTNGAKWSARLTDVRRELAALKEQLQGVSDRKRNLTEVCAQLELAVPVQETVAQRAARLECLMYRVLWVSEAVKLFHAQYAPGNPHFELFVKATNWAKALVMEYDSTVKAYCRELDKQRAKLQDLSCVDQSYEICAASLEVIKQQLEEAAMKAREEAAMSLLRELEQEEQQKKKMLDGGGKKGVAEEGQGAGATGKKSKSGKKAKAEKQKAKAAEVEAAKKREAELKAKEEEELRKERERAWKAREEERERELERRKKELEEQEAALLKAAQEASLREAAQQKRREREPDTPQENGTEASSSTATSASTKQDVKPATPSPPAAATSRPSPAAPVPSKVTAPVASQAPKPAAPSPSTTAATAPVATRTPARPTAASPSVSTSVSTPVTPATMPRSGPIKPHGTLTAEDFIPDDQLDAELKRAIELSKWEHERRQQEELRQQRTLLASLSQNSNRSQATTTATKQGTLSQAQLASANQHSSNYGNQHSNWETSSNATSATDSTDERNKRSIRRKTQNSPRTWATPSNTTPVTAASPAKSQTDTAPSTRAVSRSNSTPAQSPSSRSSSTSCAPYATRHTNGPSTPATTAHHSSSVATSPASASPGSALPVHLQFKSAAEAAAAAAASNLPKTKLRPSPPVKANAHASHTAAVSAGPPTYATKLLSDGTSVPASVTTPISAAAPLPTPADTPGSLPPAFPPIPTAHPVLSLSVAPEPLQTPPHPSPVPPSPSPVVPVVPVPVPHTKPLPAYNPLNKQLPIAAARAPMPSGSAAAVGPPRAPAPAPPNGLPSSVIAPASVHPPPPPPAHLRVSTPPDDAIVPPPSRPSVVDLIGLFPSSNASLTSNPPGPSSNSLESSLSGTFSSFNSTVLKPPPIVVETPASDVGRSFNPFGDHPLQQALAKQTLSTQASDLMANGMHARPVMSRHSSTVYRSALSPTAADGTSPGVGPDITAIMSFLGEDTGGVTLGPTNSASSSGSSIGASSSNPTTPLPTPTALPPGNLGLTDTARATANATSSAFGTSVFSSAFRRLPQTDAVPGAVASTSVNAPPSSAALPSPGPMLGSPLSRPLSSLSISTQSNQTALSAANAGMSGKLGATGDDASSVGGSTPASTPSSSLHAANANNPSISASMSSHAGVTHPSVSSVSAFGASVAGAGASATQHAAVAANGGLPPLATSGVSGAGPWMMSTGLVNLAHTGMTPMSLMNSAVGMGAAMTMRPPTGLLMPAMYPGAMGAAVPQLGGNTTWLMHPNIASHDWLARRNAGLNGNLPLANQPLSGMMLPQQAQYSASGLLDTSMRRLSEGQMAMGAHGLAGNPLSSTLAGFPAGAAGYPAAGVNAFGIALQQQLASGFGGWRGGHAHASSVYNASMNGNAAGSNTQGNSRGHGGSGGGAGSNHGTAAGGGGARDGKHSYSAGDSTSSGWKSRTVSDVDTGKTRYNAGS